MSVEIAVADMAALQEAAADVSISVLDVCGRAKNG